MLNPFHRAAISAAILLASSCAPSFAITGGISVDDVLAGNGSYTEEQAALALAIAGVTVPLLLFDEEGRSTGACTATIIHPRVVLTAAHCVMSGKEISAKLQVAFDGGKARREVLDVVVHPAFLKLIQSTAYNPRTADLRKFLSDREEETGQSDLALVLLHRPIPPNYAVLAPVPAGFRDARTTRKVIAGYGRTEDAGGKQRLHFAEMHGNTSLDRTPARGDGRDRDEGEIVMESRYRDGKRTNVCYGDSGGPVLVLVPSSAVPLQLGVTTASDRKCKEMAVFASINGQRSMLHDMFNTLMQGEQGAEKNPF